MNPKPLHRSLTFLSGLLIMAFIGFAWVDSRYLSTGGDINATGWGLGAANQAERVTLGWTTGSMLAPAVHGRRETLHAKHLALMAEGMAPPEHTVSYAHKAWGGAAAFTGHSLVLPHWLLLGLWYCVWTSLLLWRARRLRRAAILPA